MRRSIAGGAALALAGAALAAVPPKKTPALIETGKGAYTSLCAACHGLGGEGNGPVAFAIKPPPRNLVAEQFKAGDSLEQIFATVTNGLPNTMMIGYPQLPLEQRWGLAYYVLALRRKPVEK